MENAFLFICEVLDVPHGLLASDEDRRRSAAAQLLRRTPKLGNILEIEEDNDFGFTDDLWRELELILACNEVVIDAVAEALENGDLDHIIGGFPHRRHSRPWETLAPLEERIRENVGPGPAWHEIVDTVDDALKDAQKKPTILPEGYQPGQWLTLLLIVLLTEIAGRLGRRGWPLPGNVFTI